jgi:hypothetical protein
LESFFEKLKRSLGFAAGKSKNAWDLANRQSGIWIMEKQRTQLIQKLGETFYSQFRNKNKNTEALSSLCLEIERTDKEIEKARNKGEISSSSGMGTTGSSEESPMFDPNVKRCKCGTPIVPGRLFCSLCGSKLVK